MASARRYTPQQRIVRAYRRGKGCHLSFDEVELLAVFDDAMGTCAAADDERDRQRAAEKRRAEGREIGPMNEQHIKLCASMLQYAVWADHTKDRRPSEVKETLKFFFTDEEIASAIADISGKERPSLETRVGCRHCGSTPLATERGRCEECGKYQTADGPV
jgi:hypothetical protein